MTHELHPNEKLVFGSDAKRHEITGLPIGTGIGALSTGRPGPSRASAAHFAARKARLPPMPCLSNSTPQPGHREIRKDRP